VTALRLAAQVFTRDLTRFQEHLARYEAKHVEERLEAIFDGLNILRRHPMIGRPVPGGMRELVIGQGSTGYVALYRHDRIADEVTVLALRAQRESGFRGR
jgi:toxin ParE1/3/4